MLRMKEATSTNDCLIALSRLPETEEFTSVSAEFQSAGKGQSGNSWESERGKNLLFSTLLYPDFIEPRKQFVLSKVVSLAVKFTLDDYGKGFSIKWPNDIYWKNRKIGGILVENELQGNTWEKAVIGIGLNINQKNFPDNLPNPVSLCQITGQELNRKKVLCGIILRIAPYFNMLKTKDAEIITEWYHSCLYRRKGFHPFEDKDGVFMAEIQEVLPEGTLVLKDSDGRLRQYAFKEVRYL